MASISPFCSTAASSAAFVSVSSLLFSSSSSDSSSAADELSSSEDSSSEDFSSSFFSSTPAAAAGAACSAAAASAATRKQQVNKFVFVLELRILTINLIVDYKKILTIKIIFKDYSICYLLTSQYQLHQCLARGCSAPPVRPT